MTIRYIARTNANGNWEVYDTQERKVTNADLPTDAAQTMARYYNDGKCPMCPAEKPKARRTRCPICKEWIEYRPDHPGHKLPLMRNGKLKWVKPSFGGGAGWAFLGHMNTAPNHKGEAFKEAFYS